MKGRDIIVAIVIVIFFGMIILFSFGAYQYQLKQFGELESCKQITTCDKYKCLAELTSPSKLKANYLLQEQNCILKEISK